MKKIILSLMLIIQGLIADIQESDVLTGSYEVSGLCQATCRTVDARFYRALLRDFNPQSGITYCDVYAKDDQDTIKSKDIGFNANTFNPLCKKQYEKEVDRSKITAPTSSFSYTPIDPASLSKVTFPKFIAGVLTADPAFVDSVATQSSGSLVTTDALNVLKNTDNNLLSKYNLGYYLNLTTEVNDLYIKLQSWLFVFIAMFFLGSILISEVNNKLQKRQSTLSLNTLVVPLLALAIFFAPLQENNRTTTIGQKITRFFAQTGIDFADRWSVISTNVYLKKSYSSAGLGSKEQKIDMQYTYLYSKYVMDNINLTYQKCRSEFPNTETFQIVDDKAQEQAKLAPKTVGGIYNFQGCKNIEKQYLVAKAKVNALQGQYDKRDVVNAEAEKAFSDFSGKMNTRAKSYGFFNSILLPSTSIVVNTISVLGDVQTNTAKQEQIANVNTKKNETTGQDDLNSQNVSEEALSGIDGSAIGNMAFLILPGAGDIYKAMHDWTKQTGTKLVNALSGALKGIPVVGGALSEAVNVAGSFALATATVVVPLTTVKLVMSQMLEYLPIVAALIAAMIAFIGWIIELAKFYYVLPFVVVYSTTMRSASKISEFLVTGITVFIKPILIVTFISFAMFCYDLIKDIFLVANLEQFSFINGNASFASGWMSAIFSNLLYILSSIASAFLMWKIIVSGPTWLLSFVGLHSKSSLADDALSSKLERNSFGL